MERCLSKRLGWVEYSGESVVEFPGGLPAFEHETRFVLIERQETEPVIFLQSLRTDSLCFLSVPVETLDSCYQLALGAEEEDLFGSPSRQDLLCLALLTLPESGPPTANLKAPIVIHRQSRKAQQVIQPAPGYSFAQPLGPAPEDPCS
ncbi:MAG: flagellar assembly protein FliW [Bryobacterales bacterium]|nr:flagellar assembly protein FliW [Bryobacterales bacterium]